MTSQPDKVILFKDKAGEWRWQRVASNGNIVSGSGEGYKNRSDCESQALQVNEQPFVLVPAKPDDPDAWGSIEGPDEVPDTTAEEDVEHPEHDADWPQDLVDPDSGESQSTDTATSSEFGVVIPLPQSEGDSNDG